MKRIITICCALMIALWFAAPLNAKAKWKGHWYLRGLNECKEITLDRKGRTELGTYPQAIVEKRDKEYFLTVQSMGKKYSYMMSPTDTSDFELDLISVGPNLMVPERAPVEGAYSAIFRLLVDCQETMAGGVTEAPAK